MFSLSQCPKGTRVSWDPTNKPGEVYTGVVVDHNPRGESIYDIPGFDEHRAGQPGPTSKHDRVVVRADHDGKWHAQDLKSLR